MSCVSSLRLDRIPSVQHLISYVLGQSNEATVPNIAPEAAAASIGKRQRDTAAATSGKGTGFELSKHERKLRCRDNLFLVANKDFSRLDAVYKRAEAAFLVECKRFEGKGSGGAAATGSSVRCCDTNNVPAHEVRCAAAHHAMCTACGTARLTPIQRGLMLGMM